MKVSPGGSLGARPWKGLRTTADGHRSGYSFALVPFHPCTLLPSHPCALSLLHLCALAPFCTLTHVASCPCALLPLYPFMLVVFRCPHHLRQKLEKGMRAGCEGTRAWEHFKLVFHSHYFSVQKVQTSLVMTCSVEVSPPSASTIPIPPSTFTEQQKAFIGPHHRPKILQWKDQTNHYGDSNKPQ